MIPESWADHVRILKDHVEPILVSAGFVFQWAEQVDEESAPGYVLWYENPVNASKAVIQMILRPMYNNGELAEKKWLRIWINADNVKLPSYNPAEDMHTTLGWLFDEPDELLRILEDVTSVLQTYLDSR